ncbi:hypothetical protein G7Y89_g2778 [Cudoniella acicularis]|uniref:Carboxy-cis,cis-muconate cyclase n=1 Tax=Cudoniella acicularis TaxID=354080 RepID=A0A8H4RSR8_9HELO|nr:hypothetical protein G7Y89_g2778 [Cudoniella acicularis]
MRSFTHALALGVLAGQAFGTVHHMFSGVFSGADIYAIEFDDKANTLTLANSIVSNANSSKWIAIDERKQNIYVGNGAQYDSYTITNCTGLEYSGTVNISASCNNANYIIASTASPSDNEFLYSADDMGNAVWVHSVNITSGEVVEVQYLAAPTGANPRHMVVHPKGGYAYVVFEELSAIGVYLRDTTTGELTYTNTSYSLLPSTYTNTSSYWADEVQFSVNSDGTPSYMYAATRSRTTAIPGYVSAFSIDAETGAIVKQLFLTETTGSGGSANSVTSAPFREEYFAITDSGSNFVEVWMITTNGTNSATGKAVAHLDLSSGPSDVTTDTATEKNATTLCTDPFVPADCDPEPVPVLVGLAADPIAVVAPALLTNTLVVLPPITTTDVLAPENAPVAVLFEYPVVAGPDDPVAVLKTEVKLPVGENEVAGDPEADDERTPLQSPWLQVLKAHWEQGEPKATEPVTGAPLQNPFEQVLKAH